MGTQPQDSTRKIGRTMAESEPWFETEPAATAGAPNVVFCVFWNLNALCTYQSRRTHREDCSAFRNARSSWHCRRRLEGRDHSPTTHHIPVFHYQFPIQRSEVRGTTALAPGDHTITWALMKNATKGGTGALSVDGVEVGTVELERIVRG